MVLPVSPPGRLRHLIAELARPTAPSNGGASRLPSPFTGSYTRVRVTALIDQPEIQGRLTRGVLGELRDFTGSHGAPVPVEPQAMAALLRLSSLEEMAPRGAQGRSQEIPEIVREALEAFQSPLDDDHARAALEILGGHKVEARQALIGRDDFTAEQWDALCKILRPEGLEIRTNPNIKRVLVPNRGEIAIRIARGLIEAGMTPIVTYAGFDEKASWVRKIRAMKGAEVIPIGGKDNAESYLNANLIIAKAGLHDADAIHPGYGFLSENPAFARAIAHAGLVLMGPSVRTMEEAGDKDVAKGAFEKAGVPVVKGIGKGTTDVEEMIREIVRIGLEFPIRLKAVGGGGGRGQATVHDENELRQVFGKLSAEAKSGFNNGALLAERYVSRFHHVEFQIMADRFGNVIHLGERECTLQERNQKLIEIHPAALFEKFSGLKERMADAAVKAARAVNYTGHGTVEFMVDPETGEFYAMEVNARIQVEHRVTELVTGVDLIHEAVRVARGLPLSIRQEDVRFTGAAIEIRIKAFNPETGFPAPGQIQVFEFPKKEEGVFLETSVDWTDVVGPNADPMIAKILVTGRDRLDAIRRAISVLSRTRIEGSKGFACDLSSQLRLLRTQAVRTATYDNSFVSKWREFGGENRNDYPHVVKSLIKDGILASVHLEIGFLHKMDIERANNIQESVKAILEGRIKMVSDTDLKGPLVPRLIDDPSWRELLRSPKGRQAPKRIRIQVDQGGVLRQVAFFEDNKPRRVLVTGEARIDYRQDQPQTIGYEVMLAGMQSEPTISVFRQKRDGSLLLLRQEPIQFKEGTQEASFFRLTSAGVLLRLLPTRYQTGLQILDREGNLLLNLWPHEVMEGSADRFLFLLDQLFHIGYQPGLKAPCYQELNQTLADLAALPKSPRNRRRAAFDYLASASHSLIARLLTLASQERPAAEFHLLDEIMARRELYGRRHFMEYHPLGTQASGVIFLDTRMQDGHEAGIPRVMIRVSTFLPHSFHAPLREAIGHLQQLMKVSWKNARDNVLQIVVRRPSDVSDDELVSLTAEIINTYSTVLSELRLKRITFLVHRDGEFPESFTFRPKKDQSGLFAEDLFYRHLRPLDVDHLELDRLREFDLVRDLKHSGRFVHLYFGKNEDVDDFRLFGNAFLPEVVVERDEEGWLTAVPAIEDMLIQMSDAMRRSLEERPKERRPAWNRMFVNVRGVLEVSEGEMKRYILELANRHDGSLRGLRLEKAVWKLRVRDDSSPDGGQTILVRANNPTGYQYEVIVHHFVRAKVHLDEGGKGPVVEKEVLVHDIEAYRQWKKDPDFVLPWSAWVPADSRVRPATPEDIRERRARLGGGVWAYRLPDLMDLASERFLARHKIEQSRPHSDFQELDLDPESVVVNPATGSVDYNQGRLLPVVRPPGKNQAGVVIGIREDDLALGFPVRRVVIFGDTTHASRGSLSANECVRINAAIRYAQKEGLPIDWFSASSGAEIHKERGVEGLDATASVAREIILNAHHCGVPINIIVGDTNIGAQSYWNSLASIIEDTGGILIMTPKGSMALTGHLALTAAIFKNMHSKDLPGMAKQRYPNELQTLAGYQEVHGPNSEAMALAEDLPSAIEILLRHHYFSYARSGQLVSRRPIGAGDSFERDMTVDVSPTTNDGPVRTVQDEINGILKNSGGNREAILEALRDRDSPAPVAWWVDTEGIGAPSQESGLPGQKFDTLVREMQIGGQPTLAIFPPVGQLLPIDSEIIARSLRKASGHMPVLIIGSIAGFNASPPSMKNRQLTQGARIAKAMTEHEGPVVIVNMGYIVGGTSVVFNKQLSPYVIKLALEGAHETVIGGASAAKVVFRSETERRVGGDPSVREARERWDAFLGTGRENTSEAKEAKAAYEKLLRETMLPLETDIALKFDAHHSVQRALQVGAIDRIISVPRLREEIILAIQEGIRRYDEDNKTRRVVDDGRSPLIW